MTEPSLPSLREIALKLGGDVCGQRVLAPGPGHSPHDRSLQVTLSATAPDGFLVHSFASDDDLGCKDFVRSKLGLPEWKPNGRGNGTDHADHAAHARVIGVHDYTDRDGELLYQKLRYDPKGFSVRRPDGNGGWIRNLEGVRRVLYRSPEVLEAVAQSRPIFFTEGEKAADALVGLGVPATCSGGANSWDDRFAEDLKGANIIVLPDNDDPGRNHAKRIVSSLTDVAASIKVLHFPGRPEGSDAYDWIEAGGTVEQLWALVEAASDRAQNEEDLNGPRLRPLEISELLARNIPAREMILDPILPEKGLAMLYAARGVGKTLLACGISCAAAAGTSFLKWNAEKPRKVLHCDGEMPASELRDRLKQVMAGMTKRPDKGTLHILSADLVEDGIGNFASLKVQEELDDQLHGVELLVLDNLSSLTSVIRDNDAESWNPIQEWLLRLRRRGVSVLIVHHAGKGGEQRGTSRREDVLDTSISLRRPSDYVTTEGARFELHFEKARGIHGDKAKPFEVKFEVHDDAALWTMREIEDVNLARIKALLDDGLSLRDIADETGISKSTVQRLKKKIEADAAPAETAAAAAKDTPWDRSL